MACVRMPQRCKTPCRCSLHGQVSEPGCSAERKHGTQKQLEEPGHGFWFKKTSPGELDCLWDTHGLHDSWVSQFNPARHQVNQTNAQCAMCFQLWKAFRQPQPAPEPRTTTLPATSMRGCNPHQSTQAPCTTAPPVSTMPGCSPHTTHFDVCACCSRLSSITSHHLAKAAPSARFCMRFVALMRRQRCHLRSSTKRTLQPCSTGERPQLASIRQHWGLKIRHKDVSIQKAWAKTSLTLHTCYQLQRERPEWH